MSLRDVTRLSLVESLTGGLCQPRFDVPNHGQKAAILRIWERNYCRECLLERVKNDPQFAADVIVYLLLNR